MNLIQALQASLKSLLHLHDDSKEFLTQPFSVEALDLLQKKREHWIKYYRFFDTKLERIAKDLTASTLNSEQKIEMSTLLQKKDVLIQRILEIDHKILARIEEERGVIERNLTTGQKSKDTLSRFKSTWITETGEGIDTQL